MANRLLSRKLAGGLPSLKSCFSANGITKGLRKGETGTCRAMATSAAKEVSQETEVERNVEDQRNAARAVGRGAVSPFGLLDLWHPFLPTRNLRQLLETVDGIFEEPTLFAPRAANVAVPRTVARTPWDVVEDNEGFHLRVDLPGLSKDEVKVSVEENELVIQAEHSEGETKWKSRRGASTYFARLKLPENAVLDHVKAELKNGVLDVTVPKKAKADPKKVIDIQVS